MQHLPHAAAAQVVPRTVVNRTLLLKNLPQLDGFVVRRQQHMRILDDGMHRRECRMTQESGQLAMKEWNSNQPQNKRQPRIKFRASLNIEAN